MVCAFQDIVDHYILVVGKENRNVLLALVIQETECQHDVGNWNNLLTNCARPRLVL